MPEKTEDSGNLQGGVELGRWINWEGAWGDELACC